MDNDLILHIGLRKTGSSALQELFSDQREFLKKQGVYYPATLAGFPAHQELAWSLTKPTPEYWKDIKPPSEVFNHYCGEIRKARDQGLKTLLSSEDLSLLTYEFGALRKIVDSFAEYSPLIVMYVREPLSYLVSNYKHAIFEGREKRDFGNYVFNPAHIIFAQAERIESIWKSAFGERNVRVLSYDTDRFRRQSIYSCFVEDVLEGRVDDRFLDYRSNTALSDEAVEYVLALNRSDLSFEELRNAKSSLNRYLSPGGTEDFLKKFLSEHESRVLRRLYSF